MASSAPPSSQQLVDRIAIRELVDAYAHHADRRLAEKQKSLFTEKTHFVVFLEGPGTQPSQELHSREELTPVFEDLRAYSHTTHFNGQSTIEFKGDGKSAFVETYCIAHHLSEKEGQRQIFIASLRYHDIVTRGNDGRWLFAERKLYLDWSETRSRHT
jgi:SnoaL-like domain